MPRRLWIVWLVLALLPLRGWAVASMTMPALQTVQAGQADPASPAAEAMPMSRAGSMTAPCHQTADANPNGGAVNACTLCDLCHGASSVSPELTLPIAPPPDALPQPGIACDTGRHAPGGLERPPRSLLA